MIRPLRIIDAIAPHFNGDCCYVVLSTPASVRTKRVSATRFNRAERGLLIRKRIGILMRSGLDLEKAQSVLPHAEKLAAYMQQTMGHGSVDDIMRVLAQIAGMEKARARESLGLIIPRPITEQHKINPIMEAPGVLALRLAGYLFSKWSSRHA
jgi:hypothetical protein